MQTGENEQGLRKILDLTRMISIAVLLIHFYYYCYGAFKGWQLRSEITDRLLQNVYKTGLFSSFNKSKLIALAMLIISLVGARGKKDEKMSFKKASAYIATGLLLYFFSYAFMLVKMDISTIAETYIAATIVGFSLVLTGGNLLSRIIYLRLNNSVFNSLNETFPQEERLLNNEYSINLPAMYNLKGGSVKAGLILLIHSEVFLPWVRPEVENLILLFNILSSSISKKDFQCLYMVVE